MIVRGERHERIFKETGKLFKCAHDKALKRHLTTYKVQVPDDLVDRNYIDHNIMEWSLKNISAIRFQFGFNRTHQLVTGYQHYRFDHKVLLDSLRYQRHKRFSVGLSTERQNNLLKMKLNNYFVN
eukprot:UN34594